jgi:RNA polymerase-binding transcription factor DksA
MVAFTTERAALEVRRAELMARLAVIDAELDSHTARDWEEMATEREDDEVLEGMGASGRLTLQRIEAALRRIDSGTYGICVRCGDAIAPERLAAVPEAPLCRTCAGSRP